MNPIERLYLNLRSKLQHRDLTRLENTSTQIGFVNPGAIEALTKLPHIQQLEQEIYEAYQSGDPKRMRVVDVKREQLSDAELFALARLENERLKVFEKRMKHKNK